MDEGFSVVVDCIYAALSKGGIVEEIDEHLFLGDLFMVTNLLIREYRPSGGGKKRRYFGRVNGCG